MKLSVGKISKKQLAFLLSAVAVLIATGAFLHFVLPAMQVKQLFYKYSIDDKDKGNLDRLNLPPEKIILSESSKSGYLIHFQDYFFTVCGYYDVLSIKIQIHYFM